MSYLIINIFYHAYTCGVNMKAIPVFIHEIQDPHCFTKNSPVILKTRSRSLMSRCSSDASVVSIWWLYLNFLGSCVLVAVLADGHSSVVERLENERTRVPILVSAIGMCAPRQQSCILPRELRWYVSPGRCGLSAVT